MGEEGIYSRHFAPQNAWLNESWAQAKDRLGEVGIYLP
jgi:hypothetical protein